MEFSADMLLTLFAIGAIAGLVDAISGGGGLLTVPALLWFGLTPAQTLATNKLQGTFGTLASSLRFLHSGIIDWRAMRLAILLTFIGSCLGTLTVQSLDPAFLGRLIPVLLLGFALYFLFSPRVSDLDVHHRITTHSFAFGIGFTLGFYDGFFGPGTGVFFAAGFIGLLGYSLRRATAHTKLLNFTSNIASLLVFSLGGQVVWMVGLTMAAGQFVGAWIGAHLVIRHGASLIRPMLVIASILISSKLLMDQFG